MTTNAGSGAFGHSNRAPWTNTGGTGNDLSHIVTNFNYHGARHESSRETTLPASPVSERFVEINESDLSPSPYPGRSNTSGYHLDIVTFENNKFTGRNIFERYPVKTPHVSASESSGSPIPRTEDEKRADDFEFCCEVPDQCPGQWQKTLKERRRAVSDLFGRNKKCTKGLPRMIAICRMHYQANSYSQYWGQMRVGFALDQLQRNEEDFPGLTYTILLKESECERLLNFLQDKPDVKVPQNGHLRGRPFRVDLPLLQHIWKNWIGPTKSRFECHDLLLFCYELMDRGLLKNIPSIEMLPELKNKEYAINVGAQQKKLLQATTRKEFDYESASLADKIISILEDAKLEAGGDEPLDFGDDEERVVQSNSSTHQRTSSDTHPVASNVQPRLTTTRIGSNSAPVEEESPSEVHLERQRIPSTPPQLGKFSLPTPPPPFYSYGPHGLPPVHTFATYQSPEPVPEMRALEASLDATIAVSRTLDGAPADILEHLLQARVKLNSMSRWPAYRVSKRDAHHDRIYR